MSKELIERLREAAASRVARTAMIGADDLIAAADALESRAATPPSCWSLSAGCGRQKEQRNDHDCF